MKTEESLDKVLTMLYNNGALLRGDLDSAFERCQLNLNELERAAFINKARLDDLLEFDYKGTKDNTSKFDIDLSKNAQKILDKHKSYSKYLNSENKVGKANAIDRNIKNGNLIASVIVAAFAVFVGLLSIENNKEKKKLEEGIQSISVQLDSISKEVQQLKQTFEKKQKIDIATKK